MGAQNIDRDAAVEEVGVVRTDHRIVEARQHVIQPRLVLDPLIDGGPALWVPEDCLRVRNQTSEWETKRGPGLERLLDEGKHRVLVETSATQVGLLRRRHLELTAAQRSRHVDAGAAQLLEMFLSVLGGKDMIGALTALEAVAHERQQGIVLLLRRTEKGADMPIPAKHRAGQPNRLAAVGQCVAAEFNVVTGRSHRVFLFLDQTKTLTGPRPLCHLYILPQKRHCKILRVPRW